MARDCEKCDTRKKRAHVIVVGGKRTGAGWNTLHPKKDWEDCCHRTIRYDVGGKSGEKKKKTEKRRKREGGKKNCQKEKPSLGKKREKKDKQLKGTK